MFLAKIGQYDSCGLFGLGHIAFLFVTIILIFVMLRHFKDKSIAEVEKNIKVVTIIIWILEILRIAYKLYCGEYKFLDSYVPLFYCSAFLYAGLLSSFGSGMIKRAGDVVLATGGLVGGTIFLIFPMTSLPDYPAFHFISFHSFFYHGAMVYVGCLLCLTNYVELKIGDIWLYAMFVGAMCFIALIINNIFDCNLMFISKAFPGKLGKVLFVSTGKLYTPLAVLVHLFLPYYAVYGIAKKSQR